jgi:DNA topoisomerase IA
VAEKNSITKAIGRTLGTRCKEIRGRNAILQYAGKFRGKNAAFTVASTQGHLFEMDFKNEIQVKDLNYYEDQ